MNLAPQTRKRKQYPFPSEPAARCRKELQPTGALSAPRPKVEARSSKRADAEHAMLAAMNDRVAQVKVGGKVRYVDFTDETPTFYSKADAADLLAHIEVQTEKGEWISAFKWWLKQPKRRQFSSVIFEPDLAKARPDAFNMYRGRPIEPKGEWNDWRLFDDHLKRNVCAGNREHYAFFLDWCASLFQRPGHKIGVALVLFGDKGCGKSVVSDILAECVGVKYAPVVDTPEALTGKHNLHLGRALLIRVEEALHAKDPRHESRLKHLITGQRFLIEPKGVDAIEIDSKCNLIFTTNKRHSVPATAGERRFLCLDVANNNQQDGAFFEAMKEQMRNGGYAAFVACMLKRDISRRDFSKPPATTLLSTQIMESMGGLEKWWAATLASGRLPFLRESGAPDGDLEWPERSADNPSFGVWTVPKEVVNASANDYGRDYAGAPTPEAVGKFLAANVPGLTQSRPRVHGARVHCYNLPPLAVCRQAFADARPGLRLADVSDSVPEAPEDVAMQSKAAVAAAAADTDDARENVLQFRRVP